MKQYIHMNMVENLTEDNNIKIKGQGFIPWPYFFLT